MGRGHKNSNARISAERAPAPGRAGRKGTPGRKGSVQVLLLVGTKKGAFIFQGDGNRKRWRQDGPFFLGNEVNHPADGEKLIATRRVIKPGRTPTICELEVVAVKEGKTKPCARGQRTLMCLQDRPDLRVTG